MAGEKWIVVAVIRAGGAQRKVLGRELLRPQEMNLLFTLGEHVGRAISLDDITHRMKTSVNAVRIIASRLRRKLHHDWMIEAPANQGYRLCYIGGPLSDAEQTQVEFVRSSAGRPGPRRRVYL